MNNSSWLRLNLHLDELAKSHLDCKGWFTPFLIHSIVHLNT